MAQNEIKCLYVRKEIFILLLLFISYYYGSLHKKTDLFLLLLFTARYLFIYFF